MKIFLLLGLLLASCAQPRYADGEAEQAGADRNQQVSACFRDGACVALRWETLPTEDDFGSFFLDVTRGPDAAELAAPYSVLLWMPSMGHGSSPVTVTRPAPGRYYVTKVFFTMRGAWEIRVKENGDELALPFTF